MHLCIVSLINLAAVYIEHIMYTYGIVSDTISICYSVGIAVQFIQQDPTYIDVEKQMTTCLFPSVVPSFSL